MYSVRSFMDSEQLLEAILIMVERKKPKPNTNPQAKLFETPQPDSSNPGSRRAEADVAAAPHPSRPPVQGRLRSLAPHRSVMHVQTAARPSI